MLLYKNTYASRLQFSFFTSSYHHKSYGVESLFARIAAAFYSSFIEQKA